MRWVNNRSESVERGSDQLPLPSQNEVELTVANFRDNYIMSISRLLLNGDPNNEIKNFHSTTIYSDWKDLPNFRFRLMFFPVCPYSEGGTELSDFKISAYVEATRKDDWPENWICYGTRFCVFVINQQNISSSIYKKDSFNFSKIESDRGWQAILSHSQILENGFLNESGDLLLRAGVYPIGAEIDRSSRDHMYNCRRATGFVGLQNHGATCYMNALLQSLYSITKFRKSVYKLSFRPDEMIGKRSYEIIKRLESKKNLNRAKNNKRKSYCGSDSAQGAVDGHMEIDSEGEYYEEDLEERDCRSILMEEEEEEKNNMLSVGLALQNLFYKLRYSEDAPPCKELMKSFGWDSSDMFTQQDSHELLKLLLDKMEEQMKGTPVEGSVKNIFEGEMETYIECIDIDYKSCRKETFEDIQLDVQGCADIYESLKKLTEAEILAGENMYEAEGHGKQRARKGMRFLKFPPVCVFLLKRFTFDLRRMDTIKLNNRFEFYKEIDMSPFCPDAGQYVLQAVSVHHGSINSGHYYAFAASRKGHWYKFDDDNVCKVSEYAAIGDNFGGEEPDCYNYCAQDDEPSTRIYKRSKAYNAYILIYVLKSSLNDILGDCDPVKENYQMIERCRLQERLQKTRKRIRERLGQFIKVRVFESDDFEGMKFTGLPLTSSNNGKLVTFDRGTTMSDVLRHITFNLVNTNAPAEDCAFENFHVMGLTRHVNRFYCLSDLKVRFKVPSETLQELAGLIRKDMFHVYDPTLYMLFLPRRLSSLSGKQSCLFFIEYFDIFSDRPGDKSLICVELVYLSVERRISQVVASVLRKLLDLMRNGDITPHRISDLENCVAKIEEVDDGESSSDYDGSCADEDYIVEQLLQDASLHLDWYLELSSGYEIIDLHKVLGEQQLENGDLLVFNFRPTESMRRLIEEADAKFTLKEDFDLTKPIIPVVHHDPFIFISPEYLESINLDVEQANVGLNKFNDLKNQWLLHSSREIDKCRKVNMFPIYDFPSFIDWKLNTVAVTFKLYDPLISLGSWRNCCNATLHKVPISTESPQTSMEFEQPNHEVIKTMKLEIDLRIPCKHALRYVCWSMGVDPAHILFYTSPPHHIESIWSQPLSLDDFCHSDGSLGFVQRPLSELFSMMGITIRTNSTHLNIFSSPSVSGFLNSDGACDQVFDSSCTPSSFEGGGHKNENSVCMAVLPNCYLGLNGKADGSSLNFVSQIFNSRVEIIASCMGKVSINSTVLDLCNTVSKLSGIHPQSRLRLVDCLSNLFTVVSPETKVEELPQYTNASVRNLFAAPMRFEPDWSEEEYESIKDKSRCILTVLHQTPDHERFGHPFQILVAPTWTLGEVKNAIKNKLQLPKKDWDRWSFFQLMDGHIRTWKANDDFLDWSKSDDLKLLTEHPKPYEKARTYGVMRIA